MPQLQPNIVIVNGLYQNGSHTAAVGAQGIRKDLIAHQGALFWVSTKLCKAFSDALGEGLAGMGDAGKIIFRGKDLDAVLVAVGYDTKFDITLLHLDKPIFHLPGRNTGGIRHDGIVKIQHQQFDAPAVEQFHTYIRQRRHDDLGQKGKLHTLLPCS